MYDGPVIPIAVTESVFVQLLLCRKKKAPVKCKPRSSPFRFLAPSLHAFMQMPLIPQSCYFSKHRVAGRDQTLLYDYRICDLCSSPRSLPVKRFIVKLNLNMVPAIVSESNRISLSLAVINLQSSRFPVVIFHVSLTGFAGKGPGVGRRPHTLG